MPLFPAAERQVGLRLPTGLLPPDLLPKDDGTVLGAAFRQYNTLTSAYNFLNNRMGLTDEPVHEPLDIIRGTKYEQNYLENFVKSRSSTETRMIMAEIDQEEADKSRIDKSGWFGTVAAMGAGIADPTIFIPVGTGYKAIRAGSIALRTGASVAAASAFQAGIQESVLQATQQTRTGEEVALNIGAATLLGGFLDAAGEIDRGPLANAAAAMAGTCLVPWLTDGDIIAIDPFGSVKPGQIAQFKSKSEPFHLAKVFIGLISSEAVKAIFDLDFPGTVAIFWMANPDTHIFYALDDVEYLARVDGRVGKDWYSELGSWPLEPEQLLAPFGNQIQRRPLACFGCPPMATIVKDAMERRIAEIEGRSAPAAADNPEESIP